MPAEINIKGAGLAGLAAGICLKEYDSRLKINIFERGDAVASTHNNDFQQLDNWIDKKGVLEQVLEDTNIDISPAVVMPFHKMLIHSPAGYSFDPKGKAPLFYTVRRGGKDSLDYFLRDMALERDIEIHYGMSFPEEAAHIVATGAKKAQGMACGYKFDTDLKDGVFGILDDDIAPNDYAYLVVIGGKATMATVLFGRFKGIREFRAKAFERFKSHLGNFKAENKQEFAGFDAYRLVKSRKKQGRLYVGSAGGFQDALFGFGMRQAMISGSLAAKSICENKDFDRLWKKRLHKEHKNQVVLRMLFDQISNRSYNFLVRLSRRVQGSFDFGKGLRFAYTSSLVRSLYPIAKAYFHRKYPAFTAL